MFKGLRFVDFFSNVKEKSAFQIKFKDRAAAGDILSSTLNSTIKKLSYDHLDMLVVGIPPGGLIVADRVSRRLSAPLDFVLSRKLLAPGNSEFAIGAIANSDSVYLDDFIIKSLKISSQYVEEEKAKQKKELQVKEYLYGRPSHANFKDKLVILVDDSIANEATMIAAARYIEQHDPTLLIIGAPVGKPHAIDILKNEADIVQVVSTPSMFGSVSQFYEHYDVVTDEQILQIVQKQKF